MLDPWIIEEIRKREEEKRREQAEQPRVEMPRDLPHRPPEHEGRQPDAEENGESRGVLIIEL